MPEKNAKATPENQSRTSTIIGFLIQGVFFIGLIGLSFWVQITSQAQKTQSNKPEYCKPS